MVKFIEVATGEECEHKTLNSILVHLCKTKAKCTCHTFTYNNRICDRCHTLRYVGKKNIISKLDLLRSFGFTYSTTEQETDNFCDVCGAETKYLTIIFGLKVCKACRSHR